MLRLRGWSLFFFVGFSKLLALVTDKHLCSFNLNPECLSAYVAATDIAVQCVPLRLRGWKLKLVSWIRLFLICMSSRAAPVHLRKVIGVANYQFGLGAGSVLFDRSSRIVCSRKTGRVRHIYRGKRLIATLRPTDGLLALTVHGAKILLDSMKFVPNTVTIQSDVGEFIMKGGDVFAKHIVKAPDTIRPSDEVIVTDEAGKLLGVGSALLSGNDMKYFRRGVAVRVRRGTDEV